MFRVLQSPSAADRTTAATNFILSFAAATEVVLVGASRDAIDDLVRALGHPNGATFGLHRFSFIQFAARLATRKLATDALAPATALGNDAVATRAVYETLERCQLAYFSPVARFPGFARATSSTLSELRSAGVTSDKLHSLTGSAVDNAALLNEFERQLSATSIADRAMLLDIATEAARLGEPLVRCPMLFLDVPIQSSAERKLVGALVETSPAILITCPAGDLRTIHALQTLSTLRKIETKPIQGTSGLVRLSEHLFSDSVPPEGEMGDEIVFF